MTDFRVIIPARYQSSRLLGKVLMDIHGKTMLQHVYERACESGANSVLIATDHDDVFTHAKSFGAEVCMTSSEHTNGTARLAEAIQLMTYLDDDIIVNVQADEPRIPPENISQVATNLAENNVAVATLCEKIIEAQELFNAHIVKVIFDQNKHALCFSRAPIPWERDNFSFENANNQSAFPHFRHIGLYAYRAAFVSEYVNWPPCDWERMECLEQLRVLWHGEKIHVAEACCPSPVGVDTEADLQRVKSGMR